MTFCEYIEKLQGKQLSDFEKKWVETIQGYIENGYEIKTPPRSGKMLNIQTLYAINDWKENYMSEVCK